MIIDVKQCERTEMMMRNQTGQSTTNLAIPLSRANQAYNSTIANYIFIITLCDLYCSYKHSTALLFEVSINLFLLFLLKGVQVDVWNAVFTEIIHQQNITN